MSEDPPFPVRFGIKMPIEPWRQDDMDEVRRRKASREFVRHLRKLRVKPVTSG